MTDPQLHEPENALHDARGLLHAAGVQLLEDLDTVLPGKGFTGDRMDRWPPRQAVAPCGWVDVPAITRVVEASGAQAVVATFPLLFPVDGDDQAQVQLQDMLMSRGWDLFAAVKLTRDDGQPAGSSTVQSVGPADIDVGGSVLRGVVFSVQVRLLVRTLCPQRIAPAAVTT
jgi:hypothetical protein